MKSFFKYNKKSNNKTYLNYNTFKYFENDSCVFKPEVFSALIKNSIGNDYYNNYKKYFDILFYSCENKCNVIKISKEEDYKNIINLLHDKLVDIKNIYSTKYCENNRFERSCLKTKALNDVEYLIHLLYILKKIGNEIDSKSFNSISKKIRCNIVNTYNKDLPRSVVNYSAFKFCIQNYPYETKNNKLYSISNVNKNNKDYSQLYNKNFDALIDFIEDVELINDVNNFEYETNILDLTYGISIALIALSSEEDIYESFIRKGEYEDGLV